MKNKREQGLIKFISSGLLVLCVLAPSLAKGASFQASDAVGQRKNGNPVFTINGANNSPNSLGLYNPRAIAIDTAGHRLFVGDTYNGRILVYSLTATGTLASYSPDYTLGAPNANFPAPNDGNRTASTTAPYSLAYDSQNQRLFVANAAANRVEVFNVDPSSIANGEDADFVLGQSSFAGGNSGFGLTELNYPQSLAYDSARQRLFVGEDNGNRVAVFDVATSTLATGEAMSFRLGSQSLVSMPTPTTSARSINNPTALYYDPQGDRLFVGDSDDHRVLVFDTSALSDGMAASNVLGQTDFSSSGSASAAADTFNSASGLAYDTSRDLLFIADDQSRVLVFDAATSTLADGMAASNVLGQVDFSGTTAETSSQGLNGPFQMAVDEGNGHLFVADTSNNRVLVFDIASIADGEASIQVLGHVIGGVPDFDHQGANNGPGDSGFTENSDTAIDTVHHRFFVADTTGRRVVVFNLDSSNEFSDYTIDYVLGQPDFYTDSAGTTDSKMYSPIGLALDMAGNRLFVGDGGDNERVLVFDLDNLATGMAASNVLGQPDFTSGGLSATTTDRSFDPRGIAYDASSSRLFVTDWSQSRVLVFDAASLVDNQQASYVLGQQDFTGHSSDTSSSTMGNPTGLAYGNGYLFVSDQGSNERVLVFDVSTSTMSNGKGASFVIGEPDFDTANGGVPASSTTLADPSGLAYDSTHKRIFVADATNNRVLGFDANPATMSNNEPAAVVLGQSSFDSSDSGVGVSSMSSPSGVAYDPTNKRIYVSDGGNNRILAYDHVKITTADLPAATVGQLYQQEIEVANSQGTVSFALADGSLPDGMTIGSVDGTPTTAGTYTFTIRAADVVNGAGQLFDDQTYTLVVAQSNSGSEQPTSHHNYGSAAPSSTPAAVGASSSATSSEISAMKAQIADLLAQIAALRAKLGLPPVAGAGSVPAFARDLKLGMSGADVKALQEYLNSHGSPLASTGPGSPGQETELFGPLTQKALAAFQAAHGIMPAQGYFGPKTRAFIGGSK